jgi:hypothetical protein
MRFLPIIDREQREKLKPVAGDILDFQGVHYIAEQVGLKYIVAHLASDPRAKAWLKISAVSKVVPDVPIPAPTEDSFIVEQPSPHGWRFSPEQNSLVRTDGKR